MGLGNNFNNTALCLVVALLSTLVHWERGLKNWTLLRILAHHGSISGRNIINKYEFK